MPLYEHVFLARQDVSTQQVETMMKEYQQVIEELGGKIGKSEYWGLKSLAYKIKKSRKAHYALMNIDAPSAAVAEMERRMSISPDVIRFLTVRVEEHEAEQSVQMRKGDRDDRRGGDREGGDRGGFRGGDRGGFRGGGGGGGGFRGGGGGGGGFRGGEGGGGGGGFRGGEGGGGGGFRGGEGRPEREGGSTFRPRPQGDAGPRPPRPPRRDGQEG